MMMIDVVRFVIWAFRLRFSALSGERNRGVPKTKIGVEKRKIGPKNEE